MDRRSERLNSEERGVIFAEHQRGNSQCGIGRLPRRLQFRTQAQDDELPHAIRIRLQGLDFRARQIHRRSDPPNAGTEHLMCLGPDIASPSPLPARSGDGVGYSAKHLVA